MFDKLLDRLGRGNSAAPGSAVGEGLYKPYAEPNVNVLYNLLFCDDPSLFESVPRDSSPRGPWPALVAEKPDPAELRKIASDEANEGRIRALAYNRLRAAGDVVPSKIVLGVVIEVPLEHGLDVLAGFSDGGARYINQSGKMVVFEGRGNSAEGLTKELISASQPLVKQVGPWSKRRLPPPKTGNARITLVVSDGLHFTEGPFETLERDGLSGPVLAKATELLRRAVELAAT